VFFENDVGRVQIRGLGQDPHVKLNRLKDLCYILVAITFSQIRTKCTNVFCQEYSHIVKKHILYTNL